MWRGLHVAMVQQEDPLLQVSCVHLLGAVMWRGLHLAMVQQEDLLLQVSCVHLLGAGDVAWAARGHGTAGGLAAAG